MYSSVGLYNTWIGGQFDDLTLYMYEACSISNGKMVTIISVIARNGSELHIMMPQLFLVNPIMFLQICGFHGNHGY